MRSWLIYIGAFIAGLCGAYAGLLAFAVPIISLFGEMASFIGLFLASAVPGYVVFVIVYALAHKWRPSVGVSFLGLFASLGLTLGAMLLVVSGTASAAEGLGIAVLAAFCLGRYLTVRYGNG